MKNLIQIAHTESVRVTAGSEENKSESVGSGKMNFEVGFIHLRLEIAANCSCEYSGFVLS